jgi:NAD(P)H-dependent flavin oxidoreductase YrpB (nitropropane dioxygenase family)
MSTFTVPSRRDQFILLLQYDYTNGQLDELLDVIINSKAALFVSAVGVPPKAAVDRLHAAGIPIMKQVPPFRSVFSTNNTANVA